jgi:phosphate transport system substrate-binding protein
MWEMRAMHRTRLARRALLALAGLSWGGGARAGEPILIGGTGTAMGLVRHLAAAHAARSGDTVRIVPSLGSAGGLRALAAGRLDIALTLRDPGPENAALRSGLLGRTPIVLATHRATPPVMLTAAQAARLLNGDDRAWPDGAPVRLVLRPPTEREWWVLRDGPPELARVADAGARRGGAVVANTAQDNAQALGAIEGSLGLISLGQIFTEGLDLRVIGLDGLDPSLGALRAGSWPYGVAVHMVVQAAPRPEAEAFLRYLASPEASAIAEGFGYDPAVQAG